MQRILESIERATSASSHSIQLFFSQGELIHSYFVSLKFLDLVKIDFALYILSIEFPERSRSLLYNLEGSWGGGRFLCGPP
jgi:hypothetical protein